jgi:predicted enzyme related to lactoylglutathione lyase
MHVHHHAPGTFCWFELATSDQAQAKNFYSSLLAWRADDMPIGPNEFYTIFKVDGRDAAAAHTMRPEQRAQGVPPNWLLYISVDNVDARAKRAAAAGARVTAPPFDMMDAGRMTVITDPTGAAFALWEPRNSHGTGIVQEPGAAVWADLNSPDPPRAGRFYQELLGWKIVAGKNMAPVRANEYGHIVAGDEFIGGIVPAAHVHKDAPAHWLIYFQVADCDAAVAATSAAGGHVLMPPMTMERVRKFAALADPQGAAFAVVQTLS